MRPANLVTAVADILAGAAIAGFVFGDSWSVLWLVLSTIGLYGGGVVMNDVFDADLDRVERPERPIPSGTVSLREATLLGVSLLVIGVLAAAMVSVVSLALAVIIAIAAVVYDKWGKHHPFLGPVNMGLCRGLNLLLGISIIPAALEDFWPVGFVPLAYIAAITMVSRGEVHGSNRKVLYGAGLLYLSVMLAVILVAIKNGHVAETSAFVVVWGAMILVPLIRAIQDPRGSMIGRAVKAGVIALIVMNAAWAAAFGAVILALVILLLLPVSILLARVFAVT